MATLTRISSKKQQIKGYSENFPKNTADYNTLGYAIRNTEGYWVFKPTNKIVLAMGVLMDITKAIGKLNHGEST